VHIAAPEARVCSDDNGAELFCGYSGHFNETYNNLSGDLMRAMDLIDGFSMTIIVA